MIAGTSVKFRDWTQDRQFATPSSNVTSSELPFQRWKRFKESFAPEIVERAIRETQGPVKHVVDPFGGSGTTSLAAQFLGVRPTTIEVNPFLADLIEAKLTTYDLDRAASIFGRLIDRISTDTRVVQPYFPGAPATFVEPGVDGRYLFSSGVAQRLAAYRTAVGELADPDFRRLFRIILASVAIPVSNVTISGKGRRYRGRWIDKTIDPSTVDELFKRGVLDALYDLRRYAQRSCHDYRVLRGDARQLLLRLGSCDLAVFSPPYPNSFDYTDVYNVELWTMGYLDGRDANIRLRKATLRSHVQVHRDMAATVNGSASLSRTVKQLRLRRARLWNRNIPDMIGAYAADMSIILHDLGVNLRSFGRVYMVVGDSRYAGVDVPTAKILCEIARSLEYKVKGTEPFRSMRSSPQQGGQPELAETLVILERK
jgi:hypothetical protein